MALSGLPEPTAIRPVDLITVIYLLLSGSLAVLFLYPAEAGGSIALVHGLAALAIPLACRALNRPERPWRTAVLEWYPPFIFTLFYLETAAINQGSPFPSLDPWLAASDRFLFDDTLSSALPALVPDLWFAEVMAFFYFSYYLLVPGVGLYLWIRQRSVFREYVLTVAACFYFCYLLFCLFPSGGPQFHIEGGRIVWEGCFFGPMLTEMLSRNEVATGAFPSSHVAVSLIALAFVWRSRSLVRFLVAVLFAGLFLSTVYGGPHYALDLPAGLAVGWFFLAAVPRLNRGAEGQGLDLQEKKGNAARNSG